jgi:hypothetical protein
LVFLFSKESRRNLGSNQPPVELVSGSFSVIKELGYDDNHTPSSNDEVENEWSYTSIFPIGLHVVGS